MAKLDRLGWAAGIAIRSYGLRVGVRTDNAEVLELVKLRLPAGWAPAKSPVVDNLYSIVAPRATGQSRIKRFNILYKGAARLVRTMDLDELLNDLEIDIHSYVAMATQQRIFLHAGVVGWRGRAIVIPGKNFSGKTNLVTALLRAGATYYSDEFAVLDGRGRVHPYPWALHIREEGLEQPKAYPAELLGAQAGTKPLPIGMVIFSEYRQGGNWRPRRLSQGRAALEMLANAVSLRYRPEAMLAMLGHVVGGATVLKGVRGEADEAVDSILKKIGD
jgi:hypothetical protein